MFIAPKFDSPNGWKTIEIGRPYTTKNTQRSTQFACHDDIIMAWRRSPHYWPICEENPPLAKGQQCGASIFSSLLAEHVVEQTVDVLKWYAMTPTSLKWIVLMDWRSIAVIFCECVYVVYLVAHHIDLSHNISIQGMIKNTVPVSKIRKNNYKSDFWALWSFRMLAGPTCQIKIHLH